MKTQNTENKLLFCKYYDCGWCYNNNASETNSQNGACNSPHTCPYLIQLSNSTTGTS